MKFSIVTSTYNSEAFLRETIESVLSQSGDFEIEYIVIDGGSVDKTVEIIKDYESRLREGKFLIKCKNIKMSHISEKDNGIGEALNKGFEKATGDIMAWINSDDIYLEGAFQAIDKTFKTFKEIHWLKGITSFINEQSVKTGISPCYIFNRQWIKNGVYGRNAYFINQDSVFWKKSLWKSAGPINTKYKLAIDYDLWIRFAYFTDLWSLNLEVSSFRTREGQLSEDEKSYRQEQNKISNKNSFIVKLFFWLKSKFGKSGERIFIKIYPLLFWNRKKEYIETKGDEVTMRKANSYII